MLLLFVFLIFSLPPSPLLCFVFFFFLKGAIYPVIICLEACGFFFPLSFPLLFALISDFFLLFYPLCLSPHTSFCSSFKYG